MAFKHGKNTDVWFSGTDLSTFFTSADVSTEVDTVETSAFKSTWKAFIPGPLSGKAELSGMYDPTSTVLPAALGNDANVLTICPAGALAIGDRAKLLSIMSSSYAESSPVGGVVGIKWSVISEEPVGFGDVLHIMTEDTNTTTGATRDDTAATATGWIAHLHVTALDGGSWVVVLADASASNFSDGATVATFTAATTVTAQRIVSATATTALRRYVRYVATRTGGAGGDGITFGLSYARNR